jgi:hypothetical protein
MSINHDEEPVNHYGAADWDIDNIEQEVKDVSNGSLDHYRRIGKRDAALNRVASEDPDSAA